MIHQKNYLNWSVFFLISQFLFWAMAGAHAQSSGYSPSNDDFYRALVPVSSQSRSQRNQAAKEGLAVVLRRMSDSRQVDFDVFVKKAQQKAWSYVQQFEYQELPADWPTEAPQGDYVNLLMLHFSPTSIKNVLQNAKLNFWPQSRPTTLLWLVEDSIDEGKQLLNLDSDSLVIKGIADEAKLRGIPMIYPILDLEDQMKLSADDVWSLEEEPILQASSRYGADVILVGRFSVTSGGSVRATWQYYHEGETRVYDNVSPNLMVTGSEGIDPLVDFLASKYSIPAIDEHASRLIVRILGVTQFGDYRQVLDYLESKTIISNVRLMSVGEEDLMLSVASDADVDRFIDAIKLGSKLHLQETDVIEQPVWQVQAKGTPTNPLIYHWRR